MTSKAKVFWVVIAACSLAALTSVFLLSLRDTPPSPSPRPSPPQQSAAQESPPEFEPPVEAIEPSHRAPQVLSFSSIDRLLEQMELGAVAFNSPDRINVDETALIHLVLGVSQDMEELKQQIEAEGERAGAQVRVSDRMEARLSGPNFAITAITPELQAVSQTQTTEWRWEVEPKRVGRHSLHLTLSAFVNLDGNAVPRAVRTFDKVIEVEVTWPQRVSSFFSENWQWLWAAILVPLVGWFWRRRKRSEPS